MKKISFIVFVLLIAASLFLSLKKSGVKPHRHLPLATTLNGVDQQTAMNMIDTFAKYCTKDVGLKSVSAFYTVGQITTINNLLVSQKATGLRIYLASGPPVPPSTTKLNVDIYLVATKARLGGGTATLSANEDCYYSTGTGGQSTTEIGSAIYDHGDQIRDSGGSLYNPKSPLPCSCSKAGPHFLPGGEAYLWVQDRYESGGKDRSGYNTNSECFSYPFIHAFFNVLTDANNPFTGLRIYLGKGFKDSKGMIRDVFILVPTIAVGKLDADYYCCLEDLSPTPFPNEKRIRVPAFKQFPFNTNGAGYDEGELCPDVCNK